VFNQVIQVLDTIGPLFNVPPSIHVSTSCPLTFNLPGFNLVAECSDYDIEIKTPWQTLNTNGGSVTVPPALGSHLVIYKLTDACGLVRQKVSNLIIDDESIVSCPANDTITCDFYYDTLSPALQSGNQQVLKAFGYPVFSVNCNYSVTETDSIVVDPCGNGIVVRKLKATANGNQVNCTQNVIVKHKSDFEVIFPADTVYCQAPPPATAPQVLHETCEDMEFNTSDSVVATIPGMCYTIYRYWTVFNDCVFDGTKNDDDVEVEPGRWKDGGDGIIHYTQVIEVRNSPPAFPNGCAIPDVVLPVGSCEVSVTLPTPETDGCGDTLILSVGGDLGVVLGANKMLTSGEYEVNYQLADGCGKTKSCTTTLKVKDTVAPTAICSTMVTVTLPNTNPSITTVNAQVFASGSTDNCPGFKFSFSPDPNNNSTIYDCCQAGTYPVTVWVTDNSGNQDTCKSTLKLQNPPGLVCDCFDSVSGLIETETGAGIKNVTVDLIPVVGLPETTTTNAAGNYSFEDPPASFTLTPRKNFDVKNGVSTLDLVLIRKHILAIDILDSPYKIIAADANKSNSVTTADLVAIQRLILNITTAFPNANTSWRFVDADFNFSDPENPFTHPFPESIQISNFSGDMTGVNFIGLKVGDVNDSADPQLLVSGETEDK
jgi:hypothetical protein